MNLELEVYLNGLSDKINRKAVINDSMTLQSFCEHIIISLNGNCTHSYQLVVNSEKSYYGNCYKLYANAQEKNVDKLTIKDMSLKKKDRLTLNYDNGWWDFRINVIDIKEGYLEQDFLVTEGHGRGILENCYDKKYFREMVCKQTSSKSRLSYFECYKGVDEFDKPFDINTINDEIKEKFLKHREIIQPKNYIMNVSLEDFNTEIKRKISVDNNVSLDSFCRGVILSMRGDLSHPYTIKKGKEYLEDDVIKECDLSHLELQEKQRLKVIYDFGDNWTFNVTVSKIMPNYNPNQSFEVLSGKGYGIIDDCGGTWGLNNIFDKTDDSWGEYDINDFNLEEIQNKVKKWF